MQMYFALYLHLNIRLHDFKTRYIPGTWDNKMFVEPCFWMIFSKFVRRVTWIGNYIWKQRVVYAHVLQITCALRCNALDTTKYLGMKAVDNLHFLFIKCIKMKQQILQNLNTAFPSRLDEMVQHAVDYNGPNKKFKTDQHTIGKEHRLYLAATYIGTETTCFT